jgi:endonuclease/exonuclease/phosphatase family metal-dependent hydrolase
MPGFLEATIDVRGRRVRIFNTHLDYRGDPTVRRQQVLESLAIIGASKTPVLMFGDLNASPSAPELQPLFERLRDGWPDSADRGFTYPAAQPVRRIDYVLASDHFRVIYARVPDEQASDHRPVVMDLVIK